MLCPKCYGTVKKNQTRCQHCGFYLAEIEGASNKEAKKALKGPFRDDVLYTTKIPADVSKKKLLLLSIFLGLFGAHDFYVGRKWKAIFECLTISITIILSICIGAFSIVDVGNWLYIAFQFVLIFEGINVILWITDICKIAFEKYKIPVYKQAFSASNSSNSNQNKNLNN